MSVGTRNEHIEQSNCIGQARRKVVQTETESESMRERERERATKTATTTATAGMMGGEMGTRTCLNGHDVIFFFLQFFSLYVCAVCSRLLHSR